MRGQIGSLGFQLNKWKGREGKGGGGKGGGGEGEGRERRGRGGEPMGGEGKGRNQDLSSITDDPCFRCLPTPLSHAWCWGKYSYFLRNGNSGS